MLMFRFCAGQGLLCIFKRQRIGISRVVHVQHGGAVARQHHAGGGLGDRLQHRPRHVVGVGAVDELEIVDVEITGALGAVLGRSHTDGIGPADIHRHLEGGDVRFDPDPIFAGPVGKRAAADGTVGIVAIILDLGRRAAQLLAINIS